MIHLECVCVYVRACACACVIVCLSVLSRLSTFSGYIPWSVKELSCSILAQNLERHEHLTELYNLLANAARKS